MVSNFNFYDIMKEGAINSDMANELSNSSHMTRSKSKARQEMRRYRSSKAASVTPSSSYANTPMPSPTPSDEVSMISTTAENAQTTETRDNCEYYPHKKKRPSQKKKTLLKYKYNLKKIEGLNKRKSCLPQKGQKIEHQDPQRVEYSELTMFEIIRCIEETGVLDDESFMEIVDCPSPVWWEDPPDDEYCEDPIDRELVREALEGTCESPPPIEEDVQIRVELLNKELKNNDKLIKKKSKLENILGNLKTKITTINKDAIKGDKNGAIKDEHEKINHEDNERDINRASLNQSRFSESSDGDILSDISINEEEILKNLETMAIPVQLSNLDTATVTNDIIKPKLIKALEIMPTFCKLPESGLIGSTTNISAEFSKVASNSIEASTLNVTKSKFIEIQQSESSDRLNDDFNSGDFDSISDTNIRFLDDDDVEMLTSLDEIGDDQDKNESEIVKDINTITKEVDNFNIPEITNIKSLQSEAHSDSELVVVYSIVSDPAKEKIKTTPKVKKRKLKTSLERYRDANMITSPRHNNFKTPQNRAETTPAKRRRMSTDFMSMPRSVANQRKLNLCNCREFICICDNSNEAIEQSNNFHKPCELQTIRKSIG